jgi:glycerate 2-kinase
MNSFLIAKTLFADTLRCLKVEEILRTRIQCRDETLYIDDLIYPLSDFRRLIVISIGKAATPLYSALTSIIKPALLPHQTVEAIVIGTSTPREQNSGLQYFPGSHPFPTQESIEAAEAILKLLATCDERCLVFFLMSGGSSAMVEKPLYPNTTLADLDEFYRALVRSGLPITKMNALRKHFSAIKGGRLAIAARGATQCTFLISDVPDNLLHIIGSGPSLPDPSTIDECREILDANPDLLKSSGKLLAFFRNPHLEETPKADHPAFSKSAYVSLLSSEDLCNIARRLATKLNYHVEVDNRCDDWDYRDAAEYLLARLRGLRKDYPKVCLLSAGELSVQIPSTHGIGGRNQQFVLECSRLLKEEADITTTVLSGGSDGIDGNSPATGAVCDATTLERASSMGLNVIAALEKFDSYTIFDALGDTIVTGATGNNIRDLRILLSD